VPIHRKINSPNQKPRLWSGAVAAPSVWAHAAFVAGLSPHPKAYQGAQAKPAPSLRRGYLTCHLAPFGPLSDQP